MSKYFSYTVEMFGKDKKELESASNMLHSYLLHDKDIHYVDNAENFSKAVGIELKDLPLSLWGHKKINENLFYFYFTCYGGANTDIFYLLTKSFGTICIKLIIDVEQERQYSSVIYGGKDIHYIEEEADQDEGRLYFKYIEDVTA